MQFHLRDWERARLPQPVTFNDVGRCDGIGKDFCANCSHKQAPMVAGVSYWFITPTLREGQHGTECMDRRPMLSEAQMAAMDETAGLHSERTLPAAVHKANPSV